MSAKHVAEASKFKGKAPDARSAATKPVKPKNPGERSPDPSRDKAATAATILRAKQEHQEMLAQLAAAREAVMGGGGGTGGGGGNAGGGSGAAAGAAEKKSGDQKAPEPPQTLEERQYDYFKALIERLKPCGVSMAEIEEKGERDEYGRVNVSSFQMGKLQNQQKNLIVANGGAAGAGAGELQFESGPGELNMFGIRDMDNWLAKDHKDSAEVVYDDWIVQVWLEGGKKRCTGTKGSVDPGTSSVEKADEELEELETFADLVGGAFGSRERLKHAGCAHLCRGQWRYKYGDPAAAKEGERLGHPTGKPKPKMDGKKKVLGTDGKPVMVRDRLPSGNQADDVIVRRDRDGIDVYDKGRFGINIHWAGGSKVGPWSEGCQVIKGGLGGPFKDVLAAMAKAANKADFPYTLIDSSMLGEPIPTK